LILRDILSSVVQKPFATKCPGPKKIAGRRNESYDGLLFPPEQFSNYADFSEGQEIFCENRNIFSGPAFLPGCPSKKGLPAICSRARVGRASLRPSRATPPANTPGTGVS
jgi:hypothetical protein